MNEGRYTGKWYEDGHSDCSSSPPVESCEYEYDNTCFHCGSPVREHVDEDGSYRLVEVFAGTDLALHEIEEAVRILKGYSTTEGLIYGDELLARVRTRLERLRPTTSTERMQEAD